MVIVSLKVNQICMSYICYRALVIWNSKIQNGVETSTFRSEFTDMKNSVDLIAALRYKLRMFGVPIYGSTDILCDNEEYIRMHPRPNISSERNTIVYCIT